MSEVLTSAIIVVWSVSLVYFLGERFKINPLIGFVLSGILLWSQVLWVIPHFIGEIFAELGILFLLFSIWLHIDFKELLSMRKYVLNLWLYQVAISAVFLVCSFQIFSLMFWSDISLITSIFIALALALSSSAIVMEKILNNNLIGTELWNAKIWILLFQDLIAPLLLVFIPLISLGTITMESFNKEIASIIWYLTLTIFFIYVVSLISLKVIKTIHNSDKVWDETILWILIALLSWAISHYFWMSYWIGAFIGGVIFWQTEYSVKATETIEWLKEIFVAMFFIYVGTLINIDIVIKYWYIILLAAISIKIIKVISTFFACKLLKIKEKNAWAIGLNLSQVSEFSLVVIAWLFTYKLIGDIEFQIINATIILTMIITILLIEHYDKITKTIFYMNIKKKSLVNNGK